MVLSRINDKINYTEQKSIEKEDKGFNATQYKIEVKDIIITIALGDTKYQYIDDGVLYNPIYLIINSKVDLQIGVYEFFAASEEQLKHNEWFYGEGEAAEHGYNALMKDFTNYQVETDRKIVELEKEIEVKTKRTNNAVDRIQKDLPPLIERIVCRIEFAQNTINRKM